MPAYMTAEAGTATPSRLTSSISPRAKLPARAIEPGFSAIRIEPSREEWSTSGRNPADRAGDRLSAAGHGDLGRSCRSPSRGSAVSATVAASSNSPLMAMRNSGAVCAITTPPSVALRARISPSAGARSSVLPNLDQHVLLLRVDHAELRLRRLQRLLGRVELGLGAVERIDRVVALRFGRDALLLQRLGALQRFLGLPDANLGIADLGAHLRDVGLGLGAARLDLRKLRVEHRTVENGEHIALLHACRPRRR